MADKHHIPGTFPARSVLSLALLAALSAGTNVQAAVPQAEADGIEFDLQTMQARGVDPRVAEMFRHAPRFMTGESTVLLTVNGSSRGKVKARFDDNGQLCVDEAFRQQAGILAPSESEAQACLDLKTLWPQTEINADPGEERVDLVLPQQAVAMPGTESGNWNHGGVAALFNYDAQYMDTAGESAGVTFMQLGSEAGFNAGDWIVRSRQTLSHFNGEDSLQHQAAYAQRSFTESKKVLQAGQVNLSNSMFGAGQVLGFQMFPEAALQGNSGGPGLVEGIADSQSVVEVRQSGVLVYSTTVPAGPFRLQGFPLLNTRTDLDVTLTGSNGDQRKFIVPAAALLLNGNTLAPGLSFGAGRMEQDGSSESPLVGTVATGWQLNPQTTLNAGLLASSPYRAAGISLDTQPFDATMLSLQSTLAQDENHDNQGASVTATLSHNLSERVSFNVNASQRTAGYRELNDALQDEVLQTEDLYQRQYGTGISWSTEKLGNLGFSWARSTTFDSDSSNYLRGSWSKQFGRAYVGVSLEHDTGNGTTQAENRLYVSASIPFGSGQNVSSYVNSRSGGTRSGANYSNRTSQDRGWGLSVGHDSRDQRYSVSGSMDRVTSVSQLSGSLSHDTDNYTSWSARATGSVVAHNKGVTLSPYQVGDTFGIAKVGDEGGVKLDTPAGPTWTDGRGYAVLPALGGFKRSSVQVDTRSLAKNVDISNAWQETEAARGSVSYVNFDVVRTRRVLAEVKDASGNPLPRGASVFDSAGQFVTVVGEQGTVFIPDASPGMKLEVQNSGVTQCNLTLNLPEQTATAELYETATAQCLKGDK